MERYSSSNICIYKSKNVHVIVFRAICYCVFILNFGSRRRRFVYFYWKCVRLKYSRWFIANICVLLYYICIYFWYISGKYSISMIICCELEWASQEYAYSLNFRVILSMQIYMYHDIFNWIYCHMYMLLTFQVTAVFFIRNKNANMKMEIIIYIFS